MSGGLAFWFWNGSGRFFPGGTVQTDGVCVGAFRIEARCRASGTTQKTQDAKTIPVIITCILNPLQHILVIESRSWMKKVLPSIVGTTLHKFYGGEQSPPSWPHSAVL